MCLHILNLIWQNLSFFSIYNLSFFIKKIFLNKWLFRNLHIHTDNEQTVEPLSDQFVQIQITGIKCKVTLMPSLYLACDESTKPVSSPYLP